MDKENFFSKLTPKDYNNQLEKILEKKDFSVNAKNLLLSMLYKIEAGYRDYETVKVAVEKKSDYIEKLLKIIQNECIQIIIVTKANEETVEDGEEIRKSKYRVSPIEGKVELFYPNEKNLLYALFELNSTSIYFTEEYNLCRVSLSDLLNIGENMNNIEVLRDFNGWSWTIQQDEIKNLWLNLIYQNLIYLLGVEEISNWIHQTEIANYVEVIEKNLTQEYGEKIASKMLRLMCRLSIMICVTHDEKERERLLQEKADLKNELDRLSNKSKLLEDISNEKKQALKEINEIDKLLNDKEMLQEEFVKRNETRAEYNKIFSLTHLTEILNKQRRKQLAIIEENNKLMEPSYFIKIKEEKEKQYDLLSTADVENGKKLDKSFIIELQKIFIKCMEIRINKAVEKKDIIDLIYMVRYYSFLPIEENKSIREVSKLSKCLQELQINLINKAIEQKVLVKISEEKSINEEILLNLFNTKIITLENINMEIVQEENGKKVRIYDGKILEKTVEICTEKQEEKKQENKTKEISEKTEGEKMKIKTGKAFRVFI